MSLPSWLRPLGLLAIGLLAFGGLLIVAALSHRPQPPPVESSDDDPRLTWPTPYRNVRPDVAYVGDAACLPCHEAIAEKYASHPMGRSLAATSAATALERHGAEQHNPFANFGAHFQVLTRGNAIIHREERRDPNGAVAAALEGEVRFAIGSGTRGKSYLVARQGYLFQSPISWFSEKQIWDSSPGYSEHGHFNRPIIPACLFCHSNFADALPDAVNQYREPIFHGLAIGCERCHGPGAAHVQRITAGDLPSGQDDTIVNPKRLEPYLRESVCQQCHLQGEQRVLRRGRGVFDYRPGLPLHLFAAVGVRIPDLQQSYRSVGQVEQMQQSRCYQGSAGQMGCISCHDPHEKPVAAQRVEYYRGRCQQCHAPERCTAPATERALQKDNCVDCHMSKAGSANIVHTAVTDHRILRRPDSGVSRTPRALAPNEIPIRLFHADAAGLPAEESERDLGIVLATMMAREPGRSGPLSPLVLPGLEAATHRWPTDVAAWRATGHVLSAAGRAPEALAAVHKALALTPRDEPTLVQAAELSFRMSRFTEALQYWQRAIAVNPWVANSHTQLARTYGQLARWPEVRSACRLALELDPFDYDTRVLLVTACLRTGALEDAQKEFKTTLALHPKKEAELRAWMRKQTQP